MAARPEGGTTLDEKNHTVTFEKPELFNPEEDLYIYVFDSENIPAQNLTHVDELQYVVTGINHLSFDNIEAIKARKILEYYELKNWQENKELSGEINRINYLK